MALNRRTASGRPLNPRQLTQPLKGEHTMTELSPAVVEAFSKDEIGVGHALLLARLQPAQHEEALNACFREEWMGADQKPKRILLPVRQLQVWIQRNVLSS
jgi:ParB family chromosome partitioning protein